MVIGWFYFVILLGKRIATVHLQCSKTCGTGYRYRQVTCRVKKSVNASTDAAQPQVPARMCHALARPPLNKECNMSACNVDHHWSVGPWTPVSADGDAHSFIILDGPLQCSTTCGTGFRRRRVRCLNRVGDRVSRKRCAAAERPHRRQSCFLRNCRLMNG